jgi:peptide/nickel transport system substrate-binding protein
MRAAHLAAVVLLGCGGLAPARGAGTLTIGLGQDPLVIDPIRSGSFTERQFAMPVYEGLFDIDVNGRAVPWLVERYSVSDDLKTWRLSLRRGIRFHDGTPFDAEAVLANIERTRNPANHCRCLGQYVDVDTVRAIDADTVEIALKRPNAALPTLLADAPGIMVSPAAFRADPAGVGTRPVGTGPFRFVEWIRNSRFVVERNPAYWRPGEPRLDRLVLRGMQNTETRELAFKAGQLDMLLQPGYRFVSQALADRRGTLLAPAGLGTDGVYMNTRKPPLDDIRVRRAVAHAIDRALLIRTLGFGIPSPAYSPFGNGMTTIRQPVAEYPKHDPARARALLAEVGKPVAFALLYVNTPEARHLAQSLQEMWAQVGMQVDLVALDQNRLIQSVSSKQFEASLFRFTGRADPHYNAYTFYHSKFADVTPSSNYGGYASPAVDALLEQGMASADADKRAATYSELARVLIREVLPVAYLYNVTDRIVTTRAVKGVPVVPDGLVRFGTVAKD